MRIFMPDTREGRAAQLTSWAVVAYLLIQVVASMGSRLTLTPEGVRFIVAIGVALAAAAGLIWLQSLILQRRAPSYLTALRWSVVASGVALLPLADAWAVLGISLAALLLVPSATQVQFFGGAITVGTLLWLWWIDIGPVLTLAVPMICWLAAGVIVVLTRIARVLDDLRLARVEIAQMRVDQERHRISRELHDILGRTLVAASLRAQTALRLFDSDPLACRAQVELLGNDLTRGQSELRRLVSGETIIDLRTEIRAARDLLGQLKIRVDAQESLGTPGGRDRDHPLVARVLREAITNLLRHSRPTLVAITVTESDTATVLSVVNDGRLGTPKPADGPGAPSTSGGTGLRALGALVEAAGGTLTFHADQHHFTVTASVPHTTAEAPVR